MYEYIYMHICIYVCIMYIYICIHSLNVCGNTKHYGVSYIQYCYIATVYEFFMFSYFIYSFPN